MLIFCFCGGIDFWSKRYGAALTSLGPQANRL